MSAPVDVYGEPTKITLTQLEESHMHEKIVLLLSQSLEAEFRGFIRTTENIKQRIEAHVAESQRLRNAAPFTNEAEFKP